MNHGTCLLKRHGVLLAIVLAFMAMHGCGGSSSSSPPDPPPPPPPPPAGDVRTFTIELSGSQEVPPVDTAASAEAELEIDVDSGAVTGTLLASGMEPTAAHIHAGAAGVSGPVAIPLVQDTTDPLSFELAANTMLSAAQIEALLAGGLYLNVHSDAHPGGEVRGQILPEAFSLVFAGLSGSQVVPVVDTEATGSAAITLDESASATAIVHLSLFGLDDATAVTLNDGYGGTQGPVLAELVQDTSAPGHWFHDGLALDEDGLAAVLAGRVYLEVSTADSPDGLLRGQFLPSGIGLFLDSLSGRQEVPPVDTLASGSSALTLDFGTLAFQMHVNTVDFEQANNAHIHDAFAGVNGPVLIPLQQDAMNPAHWLASGTLAQEALDKLQAGGLYVNVHSPDHPGGEIRAQLQPDHIEVIFADMDGEQVVAPVATDATGLASVTVDKESRILTAHARATGLLMSTSGGIHRAAAGENGPERIVLDQDTEDVDHWFAAGAPLDEEDFSAFLENGLYVLIGTQTQPDGEIRGQIVREAVLPPPDEPPPEEPVMSLDEIQAQVFTPRCALCHFGSGNELPFSMDLSDAAASFDNLVNVSSEQVPGLLRVNPGNPDDSYLVHKLEGTQAVGDRMPQGGPFLDEDTIQGIRAWIAAGAPE